MGIYRTTSCGVCGIEFEYMQSRGKIYIGPPIIKCRQCESLNKTNWVLPNQATLWINFLDISQSVRNVLTALAAVLVSISIYIVLLLDLLGFIEMINEDEIHPIALFIPLACIIAFGKTLISWYQALVERKEYHSTLVKLFNEQGGFLWSDQIL